jgi:hypothetical protein
MENLQQVVVQLTTAPYERSLVQYGEEFMPKKQTEIIYSELDEQDKAVWDAFIVLIKSKN